MINTQIFPDFSRYRICFLAALVFCVAFFSYFGALDGEFAFDDIPLISSDPFYQENSDSSPLDCFARTYWRKELSQGLYRPLTIFSFWLNARLAGLYSPAFRIANIAFHGAAALMFFLLSFSLLKDKLKAFLCAIFFAIHPLACEAALPASGRADSLCAFFILFGLFFHISSGFGVWRKYIVSFACLAAALSKENGLILPALCLLWDIFFRRDDITGFFYSGKRKAAMDYLLYFSAIVLYFFLKWIFDISLFPKPANVDLFSDNQLASMNFGERLPTATYLQFFAIGKFLLPFNLSHDYSFAQILPIKSFWDFRLFILFLSSVSFIAFLIYLGRKKMYFILFCVLSYIISILPISNILIPIGTIFGERLYYFPNCWLSLIFISLLFDIAVKFKFSRNFLLIIFALIFSAFLIRLILRQKDWQNPFSLAIAGIKSSPMSEKMWNNYAVQLASIEKIQEAESACTRALEIYPNSRKVLKNRAFYRIKLGKKSDALADLEKVISLGSNDPEIYNKAGAICAVNGKYKEAMEFWKKSLLIQPGQKQVIRRLKDIEDVLIKATQP
jgi:hypothetical protein